MKPEPNNWNAEIAELEKFFTITALPEKIRLNSWSMIVDAKLFKESHMSIVRAHNGEELFSPYLNRLFELKNIIEKQ